MFYIFLIFCDIQPKNIELNKVYYNNLKYLNDNCSINFKKHDNLITFSMIKICKINFDLNLNKNKNFLIYEDEIKKYKNLNVELLSVFNYVNQKEIFEKNLNLQNNKLESTFDMRIYGCIKSDNLIDIDIKNFQKYLLENYALILTNNKIDFEKINLKIIK